MFAEGADPHQREVALEEVEQLGQFVDPKRAQDPAPGSHAEIVLEFSAFLQGVGLIDVILQVFAVRMHGAEFFHVDGSAALAQAFKADERTVGGIGIGARRS